jgi:hypothetical protein
VCTVSLVPSRSGVRIVCNRDERRARPEAYGPGVRQVGRRTALFPVDPVSGGTWIAANDSGLAIALLNRTSQRGEVPSSRRSRGLIIPSVLGCDALDAAVDQAMRIDASTFEPFRLVFVQRSRVGVVASDGVTLLCERETIDRPRMFTSSSLGDHIVEAARRALFERMLLQVAPGEWRDAQRRFHRHRWRTRPEISIVMTRSDARTVSRTTIDLSSDRISLNYRPLPQVQ